CAEWCATNDNTHGSSQTGVQPNPRGVEMNPRGVQPNGGSAKPPGGGDEPPGGPAKRGGGVQPNPQLILQRSSNDPPNDPPCDPRAYVTGEFIAAICGVGVGGWEIQRQSWKWESALGKTIVALGLSPELVAKILAHWD